MTTLKSQDHFLEKSNQIDNDEAEYNDILLALFALDEKRRSSQKEIFIANSKSPTLEEMTLDIERAEALPTGSIFGLHKLENTDHLFIRHTEERSPYIQEMKRRFEILNARGERVLFAVEETNFFTNALSYSTLDDFDFRFMDPKTGIEAFKLVSRGRLFGFLGTKLKVFKDKLLMGQIIQSGEYGSTVFRILSRTERLRFLIKPTQDYIEGIRPSFFQRLNATEDIDINFPDEFNILSADESILIGRITGVWRKRDVFLENIESSDYTESDEDLISSSSSSDENESPIEDSDKSVTIRHVGNATSSTSITPSISTAEGPTIKEFMRKKFKIPVSKLNETVPAVSAVPSKTTTIEEESSHVLLDPKDTERRFNRQRYEHFLEVMKQNTLDWEWYFEGEHFGAQFTAQLGSITRAMIVSVILVQYFHIHFDRHHRRKGSRLLYKKNFKRWFILTGIALLVSFLLIGIDINRDRAPW